MTNKAIVVEANSQGKERPPNLSDDVQWLVGTPAKELALGYEEIHLLNYNKDKALKLIKAVTTIAKNNGKPAPKFVDDTVKMSWFKEDDPLKRPHINSILFSLNRKHPDYVLRLSGQDYNNVVTGDAEGFRKFGYVADKVEVEKMHMRRINEDPKLKAQFGKYVNLTKKILASNKGSLVNRPKADVPISTKAIAIIGPRGSGKSRFFGKEPNVWDSSTVVDEAEVFKDFALLMPGVGGEYTMSPEAVKHYTNYTKSLHDLISKDAKIYLFQCYTDYASVCPPDAKPILLVDDEAYTRAEKRAEEGKGPLSLTDERALCTYISMVHDIYSFALLNISRVSRGDSKLPGDIPEWANPLLARWAAGSTPQPQEQDSSMTDLGS
jgi:hypothetical protein